MSPGGKGETSAAIGRISKRSVGANFVARTYGNRRRIAERRAKIVDPKLISATEIIGDPHRNWPGTRKGKGPFLIKGLAST